MFRYALIGLVMVSCGGSSFTNKFYVPTYSLTDPPGTNPADLSNITSVVINTQSRTSGIKVIQIQNSAVTIGGSTFELNEDIVDNTCPPNLAGCNTNDSSALGISSSVLITDMDYLRKNIRDQGARNTCVAFAMASALEILRHNLGDDTPLSEQNAYFLAKKYTDSWTVSGLNTFETMSQFANLSIGFCPGSSWPYNPIENDCTLYLAAYPNATCTATEAQGGGTDGKVQDPNAAATSKLSIGVAHQLYASIGRVRQALYRGYPVLLSVEAEVNFVVADQKSGVIATAFADDPIETTKDAGHTTLAVGYQDDPNVEGGGYLILKNSWGTTWGDAGMGYATYAWVEKNITDAQAIVSVASK
ncbi:MAG: C1 family peptidase [bacterium]